MSMPCICVCCQGKFDFYFSQYGNSIKKTYICSCCMAPICKNCFYRSRFFCCFCAKITSGNDVRKSAISSVNIDGRRGFTDWGNYCSSVEVYKRSIDMMHFLFYFLNSYPNKVKWYTMHTSETNALYDAFMRQSMRLFLFNRVPTHLSHGIKLVFSSAISKFSGKCFKVNQLLDESPLIRFPGRRDNIKALFGFISKIVMRMAFESHNYTHSDGFVEVVYSVNSKMSSSILRRILSLK